MSTDTDEIKNQLENNAELIDLLSSLKELGCRFPGQTVKLSLISIAEDNIKKAASLLDEILAH
ncbi:MAG TPA: hypothetical protein VGU44_04320, partial [Gammaproteobacteria bacterium]|nr:hypothetical protein [Gammaproteobacteria bacterium]